MTDAFSDLVLPIFRRVLDLTGKLSAGGESLSIEEVKAQTRSWIEDAELRASSDASLSDAFGLAKYGLVGWIDEVLTDSSWGKSVRWGSEDYVLEWDVYRDHNRATKFYEHAEVAFDELTQSRASADSLETFLLCVALGFRGEKRDDEAKFNVWVDRVYTKVSEYSNLAERPFPENPDDVAGGPLLPRSGPALLLKVSILSAITAVVTLAAYIASVHIALDGSS